MEARDAKNIAEPKKPSIPTNERRKEIGHIGSFQVSPMGKMDTEWRF